MYNYILYLFGYNTDYYDEPQIIITDKRSEVEDKIKIILDKKEKRDVITNYDLVITELKEKIKHRLYE